MTKQNTPTNTFDDYYEHGIPTAAYTFLGACAIAIIGTVVFEAAQHFLCDD